MRLQRSALYGVAVASLVLTGGLSAAGSAASAAPPDRDRGGPGTWTKISTGGSGTTYHSSLYRTPNGVLHVVYPKGVGSAQQLGHTAIRANGTVASRQDVLAGPWSVVDSTPAVIGGPGGGLRVVFGGQRTTGAGYWSDGRMYTATSSATGASWALPTAAVGQSHEAYGSYGTAATTLADGTPIAAYPLNSTITWHVGTGEGDPDQSFEVAGCCVYNLAMVRDGSKVWLGWYANGGSASTNGTFVRQIHPSLGPIRKAPASSRGADSLATGRVALAARVGGGVYAAYCVGYPTCSYVRLWKVGTSRVLNVTASRYATAIALSAGPAGRLWTAWADNIPRVRAMRTSRSALLQGPWRTLGMPRGSAAVHDLSLEGSTGRGDVVIQVGNGFWHSQVLAGLTLAASPARWRHGVRRTVTFTVRDAGEAVSGARVRVGARHCTTGSRGKCVITFRRSVHAGRLVATAVRSGYASARVTLRVR
ncbi:hypothetical protein [Nocardioides sp. URHA0020]|uniref:hypothetical protein n=1 Tax=Nocardioides sp. URHA0020 TaxID=1380392 RepID=UPI00048D3AC5|nr:hypothetical protein [Nocardioides sp. URHA0020]